MSNLETLEKNINIIKENLKTLPQNTKADKMKYRSYVNEILDKYNSDKVHLAEEIQKRCSLLAGISANPDVKNLKEQIENFDVSCLLDDYKSSYEKLKLDIPLYDIEHFYKSDLEKVNEDIKYCVEIFKKASVKCDFNYSIYVKEYMDTLMNNDSTILDVFKKLYSECPDLITHLEVNIKSIYYKNIKVLDKYYEISRPKVNLNDYHNLIKSSERLLNEDSYNIFDMFINDKLHVKDFVDNKNLYEKYNFQSLECMYNLYHDLEEYQNYLKYRYIIDDIIEKYKDKDKSKGLYDAKLKEIMKVEKTLTKTNNLIVKLRKKKTLNEKLAKKLNLSVLQVNALILQLKGLYDELLDLRIGDKILKYLDDGSSLFDVLLLGSSFYDYMVDLMKKSNESVSVDIVKKEMLEVKKFLCGPYLNIVKNTNLNSEKDIAVVISDKYRLLNIPIEIEAIADVDSINKIMNDLFIIIISESLKKVNYNISDVDFYIKVNKNLGPDFLGEKL